MGIQATANRALRLCDHSFQSFFSVIEGKKSDFKDFFKNLRFLVDLYDGLSYSVLRNY